MFVDYKERRDRSGRVQPSDHGAGLTCARGEGPSRPLNVCCLWNRKEVALTGSSRGGMASEEPKGQRWSCWAAVFPAVPSLNLSTTPRVASVSYHRVMHVKKIISLCRFTPLPKLYFLSQFMATSFPWLEI